jgi:ubiquinone/menaquinone biosynthesis C-methylase UbiE
MSQPDPVMESYDRLATDYDQRWRSYEEATLNAALEAISCKETERLLDVACGTGELERMLLARCPAL